MTNKEYLLIGYGCYLILLSIITFFAYRNDKKKAEKWKYRTKEKTLLLLSFLGGAYGGYPAMLIFHHKTKGEHWYFTFINILGIVLHISTIVVIYLFVNI